MDADVSEKTDIHRGYALLMAALMAAAATYVYTDRDFKFAAVFVALTVLHFGLAVMPSESK